METYEYDKKTNINEYIIEKVDKLLGKHNDKKNKTILVMSGGGLQGLAHVGGLKALEENGLYKNIKTFVGASMGGLIATFCVLGYTPSELEDFAKLFDFDKLYDINFKNFFGQFGLDPGNKFILIFEKFIEQKGYDKNITMYQLYESTGLTLILTAVCINNSEVYYISHKSHPDMPVKIGLRMTMSVPIWLAPVDYKGKLYIDGGCIDNYPVEIFKNCLDSVIGMYIVGTNSYTKNISNVETFLSCLLESIIKGRIYTALRGYENITIQISPQENLMRTTFEADINMKTNLINTGYLAALEFLNKHALI